MQNPLRIISIVVTSFTLAAAVALLACDAGEEVQGARVADEPADPGAQVQEPVPPVEVPPSAPTALVAETLTEADELPSMLAADPHHIYWMTAGGGLERVAKRGGAVEELAPADGRTAMALAVRDGFVFWAATDELGAGSLKRIAASGGAAKTLVVADVVALAVDDEHLRWVERDVATSRYDVWRANRDGGMRALVTTVTGEPGEELAFSVGPDAVYWLRSFGFGERRGTSVWRMPEETGSPDWIAWTERSGILPGSLRAGDAQVVWQDWARRLLRVGMPGDGGAAAGAPNRDSPVPRDSGLVPQLEVTEVGGLTGFRTFAPEGAELLAVRLYEPGIVRLSAGDGDGELVYETSETSTDVSSLVVEDTSLGWAEWSTTCTEERFEGKSAYCVAFRFEVQLLWAAR